MLSIIDYQSQSRSGALNIVLRHYPSPYPNLHNNTSKNKKVEATKLPLGTVSLGAGMARDWQCLTVRHSTGSMKPGVNDGGISQRSMAVCCSELNGF